MLVQSLPTNNRKILACDLRWTLLPQIYIYIPDLFATSQTWWKWLHSHDGPAFTTFKRQFLNKPDHNSNEKLLSVHCTFIPFLRKIKHDKHSYADISRRQMPSVTLQRGLLKRNTINESSVSCQKDWNAWMVKQAPPGTSKQWRLNCSSFPCWRLSLALPTLTILYIPSVLWSTHPPGPEWTRNRTDCTSTANG